MEIIYRQPSGNICFEEIGVSDCWVKYLHTKMDIKNTNHRLHHHTGFEIHIMKKGRQKYIAEESEYDLTSGYTLIIPHKFKHRTIVSSPDSEKISFTFKTSSNSPFVAISKPIFFETGKEIDDCTDFLADEYQSKRMYNHALIEGRTREILVQLLRKSGMDDKFTGKEMPQPDYRISMAKQYISDNIDLAPNVSDVAAYCYLSSKQLTRLFREHENTTPAAYIRKLKTEKIEKLLATDLSLKDISAKMNFSDEFHFNSFFKVNSGMSPGEFRKMIK